MPARAASFRSVFAVAGFRRIWLAHLLSVAGDQLARVALTVLVFDRTSSAGWASAAYALTFVPDLFGGALGGIADRFSRRTVMVVTDVGRAVLIALMAVPGLPLPAAAALLFLVQLMAGPFHAARQAMLPDLLDPDRLVVGQAVISSTYQAGLVVGFGAGAAVVTGLGVPGALLIDAGTFALSALMLRFGIERYPPSAPRHHRRPSLIAGCRLVARDRKLRWLLLIACCGFYVVPEILGETPSGLHVAATVVTLALVGPGVRRRTRTPGPHRRDHGAGGVRRDRRAPSTCWSGARWAWFSRAWSAPATDGGGSRFVWQMAHDLPMLSVAHGISVDDGAENRILFVPMQLLYLSPVVVPVWIAGALRLWCDPELRWARSFAVAYPVLCVLLLLLGGKRAYAGLDRTWRRVVAVLLVVSALGPILAVNKEQGEQAGWPRRSAGSGRKSPRSDVRSR